jgi:hypothetical protein
MSVKPPGGGIDYLPSGGGGLSYLIELLARLFSVIQTSAISIGLILAMLGTIFYIYSQRQSSRGLQLVEGGVIVVAVAAVGIPIVTEATSYVADGDPNIGTVRIQEEAIEVVATESLNTTARYPIGPDPIEASLGPMVAIFGNLLSVLMVAVLSAGIVATLFALILLATSSRRQRVYARHLLRGGVLVTICASAIHLILGTLSWLAVGSESTDRAVRPITLRGNAQASDYYHQIQLPHEAATPDVVYPVTPGDATVLPALQLTDRIAVLSEVGAAYLAVVALILGLILHIANIGVKPLQKYRARQFISFAVVILVIVASVSFVVTAVGWVATGEATTEQTIHQPGAPYADGTHFSSGSVEGWQSETGAELVAIGVDGGGMGLFVEESDIVTRQFEVADAPGDHVLVTVETQGSANVTVLENGDTALVEQAPVNGTAAWVTQTNAETLTIEIASPDTETVVIEAVEVTPVIVEQ